MGASRDKLVLGLPLYGQSFTLEDVNKHSLHDKTKGPGVAGELTQAASTLAFSEVKANFQIK
ncbi:hypothetical protein ONE63_003572 [Megalurothrips usitatus]|uniref:Chitinase n=1 Tax=Megalurothrips usitatus TaxID=439358 RepID=A0AAV7X7C4_9NEOP|nr:hypothetical protein ONE63_003572 [Megalurothrips usitatus]